jgi:hypothetical protein
MQPFRLEAPYVPGEGARTLQLLLAGTLVVSGIALALNRASLIPLSLAVAGVLLFAWLMHNHPRYEYFTLLSISEKGIEYAREQRPDSPKTSLNWAEVKSVSARLASQGEEIQGLEVVSLRYGNKGVPTLLPLGSEAECKAAVAAAEGFCAAHRGRVAVNAG